VVNRSFTKFSLFVRYFFLILSVLGGVFYLVFFFKVPKELRTFENKYIAVLSVLLVFFNEPLYYFTVYSANTFFAIFSVFSVVLFAAFLLVFWLVMI